MVYGEVMPRAYTPRVGRGASGESKGLRRYDKENLLWQSGLILLAPKWYNTDA
jgi:hypothetical protein